jgi:prevent-host-death family protein
VKRPSSTMPKEITAINLRHKLGEILDRVANERERFLIKRSGIPAAVLLSISDFEDLQDLVDTWYEQQDANFQKSLGEARRDIDTGKVATLDDLRRDLKPTFESHVRKPIIFASRGATWQCYPPVLVDPDNDLRRWHGGVDEAPRSTNPCGRGCQTLGAPTPGGSHASGAGHHRHARCPDPTP